MASMFPVGPRSIAPLSKQKCANQAVNNVRPRGNWTGLSGGPCRTSIASSAAVDLDPGGERSTPGSRPRKSAIATLVPGDNINSFVSWQARNWVIPHAGSCAAAGVTASSSMHATNVKDRKYIPLCPRDIPPEVTSYSELRLKCAVNGAQGRPGGGVSQVTAFEH